MRFKSWFYSLFRLRFSFAYDTVAHVATIHINKPPELLAGEEENEIKTLSAHFAASGYHVIIRNY